MVGGETKFGQKNYNKKKIIKYLSIKVVLTQ